MAVESQVTIKLPEMQLTLSLPRGLEREGRSHWCVVVLVAPLRAPAPQLLLQHLCTTQKEGRLICLKREGHTGGGPARLCRYQGVSVAATNMAAET